MGASIGLDRLIALLEESGHLSGHASASGVVVGQFSGVSLEVPFQIAARLRAAGITAECFPDPIPIGKQMAYGASRGYRFGLILGPDELSRGVFHLRDLITRQESKDLPIEQVAEIVALKCAEQNQSE